MQKLIFLTILCFVCFETTSYFDLLANSKKSVLKQNCLSVKCVKKDQFSSIKIYRNQKINFYIQKLSTTKRKLFERGLKRSPHYLAMIFPILKKYDLPQELAYLPAVESNYNPKAKSWASAVGLWQFIRKTGRKYHLNQSYWHDERLDPEHSTHAAAKYLKKLYLEFGTWELALAAYNCGERRVHREIRRNKRKGLPTDYWSLKLPKETQKYVPKFLAVTILFKNLKHYGFQPQQQQKKVQYKTVSVQGGLTFKQISTVTNTNRHTITTLNPSLYSRITPVTYSKYELRFPISARINQKKLKQLKPRKIYWITHRVRRGDSLWKISRRYKVSARKLALLNHIYQAQLLRQNQRIRIPIQSVLSL
ncbi:MAG: membrane-bound lytic murein transglycosylase D [bacterium]